MTFDLQLQFWLGPVNPSVSEIGDFFSRATAMLQNLNYTQLEEIFKMQPENTPAIKRLIGHIVINWMNDHTTYYAHKNGL